MMATSLQESFDRSCRLCAEEQGVTILLFGAEAEAMSLHSKLNKYLLIEIDEDDKLPKIICLECCTKLNSVCDFIEKARKCQDILVNRSLMLEQKSPKLQIKSVQSLSKLKQEPIGYNDDENQVTEMEINVDPMMVLQNSESYDNEQTEQTEQTVEVEGDDVSHLHGLSGENVTLKLIKRPEVSTYPIPTSTPTNDNYDSDTQNDGKPWLEDNGSKPFSCHVCKRSYFSELALKNHSWNHSPTDKINKKFKCFYCYEAFDFRVDLNSHMKTHKSLTTCKICKRIFRNSENLRKHMVTHTSENDAFVCKVCGRSYNNRSNLKTHSVTHSNERPFKCQMCTKSFKRNQDLKFHINQHIGAKPYRCPFCEKCFASSGNCYSHRNRMHPGQSVKKVKISPKADVPEAKDWVTSSAAEKPVSKYQCQRCLHSFTKKDNYLYHMYQHTGRKPFQCYNCPNEKFVSRKGLLLHHSKVHGQPYDSEKILQQYGCNTCGETFSSTASLVKHEEHHIKDRPFVCTLCPSRFKQISHLRTHEKTHSDEKKFGCSVCMKFFKLKGTLVTHLKTHSGVKPYLCHVCGDGFSTYKRMTRHKNSQHGATNKQ